MVTGEDKYVHAPMKVGTEFVLNFDQRVALSSMPESALPAPVADVLAVRKNIAHGDKRYIT